MMKTEKTFHLSLNETEALVVRIALEAALKHNNSGFSESTKGAVYAYGPNAGRPVVAEPDSHNDILVQIIKNL